MITNPADYKIDKTTWGEGPWQSEPDRVDFYHAGLPCLLLRHERHGHWCGYAGVPPGHPLHGNTDTEDYGMVHGGITYAAECDGDRICHVPKPGEAPEVWWFGFDCAHSWDISPARVARDKSGFWNDPEATYCTVAYVRAEAEKLAEWLASRG